MNISDLDISCRAYNCLKRAGINTTEDLCNMTTDDMWRVRNLGRKSLEEILGVMKDQGLKFRESEE
jgi:DNA-directed RNA polymerase subunit alpha